MSITKIKYYLLQIFYYIKYQRLLIKIIKKGNKVIFNENYDPYFEPSYISYLKTPNQKTYFKHPQFKESTKLINCQFEEFVNISKDVTAINSTFKALTIINKNSFIYNSVISKYVKLGNSNYIFNSSIDSFTYTSINVSILNTEIGRFCSIAQNVLIGGGNHPTNYLSSNPVFYSTAKQCGVSFSKREYFNELEKVIIGNDVWIGANAVIGNGLIIGDGAIIGAGAIVVKDIPPYAIVGGVPAKLIRYRFNKETIAKLLDLKWWNWDISKLRININYFQTENFNNIFKTHDNN